MEIIRATKAELSGIMEIERDSFSIPWSESGMLFEIESGDAFVGAATENGDVIGFVILHRFGDEGEIFNIAVRDGHRKNGIGTALMKAALSDARENKLSSVYLEVRESNKTAYDMYIKCGFSELAVRKNYYDAPKENAIIMVTDSQTLQI